ncbi:MAG: Mov34/MPN/PAD-1 family protein [Thermoplasmata archaeon]
MMVRIIKSISAQYPEEAPPEEGYASFVDSHVIEDIQKHTLRYACLPEPLETIGLLYGRLARWHGSIYSRVTSIAFGKSHSTRSYTRINWEDEKEISTIIENIDELPADENMVLVGWYHSHPGFGCFMSTTDRRTQKRMFPKEYQIAIVIDPLKDEFQIYNINGIAKTKILGEVSSVRISNAEKEAGIISVPGEKKKC